jgi:hypothetical protein
VACKAAGDRQRELAMQVTQHGQDSPMLAGRSVVEAQLGKDVSDVSLDGRDGDDASRFPVFECPCAISEST